MEATSPSHQVREIVGGAAHLCDNDTPICGAKSAKLITVRPISAEAYVTCTKCRKLAGWSAGGFGGSKPSFATSGWGANRGR